MVPLEWLYQWTSPKHLDFDTMVSVTPFHRSPYRISCGLKLKNGVGDVVAIWDTERTGMRNLGEYVEGIGYQAEHVSSGFLKVVIWGGNGK